MFDFLWEHVWISGQEMFVELDEDGSGQAFGG
jgi:hypothetical protein